MASGIARARVRTTAATTTVESRNMAADGGHTTGSSHIGLEFCGRHFEFLIRVRSLLVRGLEPRSYKSGTRRIRSLTENNKVTRDETSHFFRRMSLPVGVNGNKM